jgi:hypothetical protein
LKKPAPRIVDLSEKELEKAEGLKSATPGDAVTQQDLKANPGEHVKVGDELTIPSKEEIDAALQDPRVSPEILAAEKELQQAVDDKAHHMTIKKLQAALDTLKGDDSKAV